MFAATTSATLVGAKPRRVEVEAHVGRPKDAFHLVGLPDTAVREAKERVRAAMLSSSFEFPGRRVTVNLAPANLPKGGSAFDLPIALGVLAAAGLIPEAATRVVALGELALDGSLRAARGTVAAAMVAADLGLPLVVPEDAVDQAGLVDGVDVRPVRTLAEAIGAALGAGWLPLAAPAPPPEVIEPDMADVRGHHLARRAVEIAAAGGHHLLMVGPPGSGKSMLARRMGGLLPDLTTRQRLELTCVWESGDRRGPPGARPPFRSPHHTASAAALLGGGSGHPVPGEVSLATHGILFLDELGEVPAATLDGLRQPIEDGFIDIARRGTSVRFPAGAQVVAATNPCPCGYRGDRLVGCRCSEPAIERYRRRLSGPLLDRFDLRVWVARPERLDAPPGETTAAIAQRVAAARRVQAERGLGNHRLTGSQLDDLAVSDDARQLLSESCASGVLNGRGYDRVRRVARTIADLGDRLRVEGSDVAEAIALRQGW